MRKILLLVIGILTFLQVEAQVVLADSGNHGLMTISTKKSERLKSVEGSPYLDEEFRYGVAYMEDKEPLKIFMRYDVSTETFELKTDPSEETVYKLPLGKAKYSLNGDTYIYDEIHYEGENIAGYFAEHFSGDHLRLLEKPTVEFFEAVSAKTGYDRDQPARIKLDSEIYIVKGDGQVENVRIKHRDIKKAFNSGPAKKYLSDNKVRSLEDLISFLTWMDRKAS